jgi:diguanylate cyclase (GGDEF)-like protein
LESFGNYLGKLSRMLLSLRQHAQARLNRDEGHTGSAASATGGAAIDQFDDRQHVHAAPHLLPIFATAVMGAALSIATYYAVTVREERAAEQEFIVRASNVASALQSGLNGYFDEVVALRALVESSAGTVSRSGFEVFANRLTKDHAAILSVSWIPRVKRDERAAHELAAARDGIATYHIRSVAADGSVAISPEQDEYYPVYYTTEKQRSGSVYGLDLGDDGIREQVLIRSRDGNQLAASDNLVLQSGTGDRRGFFVVLPVYRQGLSHDTVESRRRNLIGFVQGVFQTGRMVDTILDGIRTPVDLYMFAPTASGDPIHIFSSKLGAQPTELRLQANFSSRLHWSGELNVADHRWKLIAVPLADGVTPRHATAWTLLVSGFLLTAVGAAFMWSSRLHALRLVHANRKVSQLAQTDALTSLANRRAFISRLASSFDVSKRNSSQFAMLSIDLDQFKDVNDSLGHAVGDILLRQVAERLKASVRQTDVLARIGGDEFAVLMTYAVDATLTKALAAKIVEMLAAPYMIDGNELHITASIGASHCSAELSHPEAMMVQTDLALYRAKEKGRNCFSCYSKHLDQQVRERVTLGDELRVAIQRGELELHYQPQVEISSGRIVGLEALVRWASPKRGFVPPSTFIPIAEKTGSIIPLGRWVFDEACRQMKLWQDQGIVPDVLAVNVSAIQCKQPEFLRDISASLARWGINPTAMEVELTESVLMEMTQQNRDIVENLQQLGLRIAIDDFGTGYSSLNYLTNFPVDRLKIAQELIFRVTTDLRNATVVRAAIRLADELGIEVIAEGVETEAQAKFFVSAGCAQAQGYYFSRPLNAQNVTELLRRKRLGNPNQPDPIHDRAA